MSGMLIGLLAYVLLQLVVGFLVSRRLDTESDYLIAGRQLGPWMAVLSIFATWFGAESCIGASGAVYGSGFNGASAEPFGYAACLLLMGVVFAAPLWRRKLSTLADLFRDRFSPGVERLVVLMMVPTSVMWAAAQVRGFGQVLAASSELNVDLAIGIGALVAIIYTTAGGLLADVITDMMQGCVLIIGLIVLAWFAIPADTTWGLSTLHHPSWATHVTTSWLSRIEAWTIPIIGSVWAQELGARVLACRSGRIARNASITAGGIYFLVGCIPLVLGLLGPTLLPGLTDHEQFLPRLAQLHLPTWAYIVFAGGLISAILSTVDSALLSAASLTSHNLLARMRPHADDRTRLLLARTGVVVFGLLSWWLAVKATGVYELVENASSFGSAGLFVAGTFGLFTNFGGPRSASAALIVGAGVWLVASHATAIEAPYLAALACAFGSYVLIALFHERHPGCLTHPTPVS